MRSRVGLLLVVLATAAARGAAEPPLQAYAQGPIEPAPGTLLVARSEIAGGPFHRSVVLLLVHGAEGTLGVIVNRPTEIPLDKAIPDLEAGDRTPSLFFGGPVALDGLLVVLRTDTPPAGAAEVVKGLSFSGEREVLDRLLEEERPDDEWRPFIGHSGWAPGQLADELDKGSWNVRPTDPETLFRMVPEWMWERMQESGGTIARARSALPVRTASRSASVVLFEPPLAR